VDEGTLGLVILVGLSLLASLASHAFVKGYLTAAIVSTLMANLLFQIFAYFRIGFLDPFFLVALLIGSLISLGIALLIGLPFWIRRKRIGRPKI
jgi:hypothetical protein